MKNKMSGGRVWALLGVALVTSVFISLKFGSTNAADGVIISELRLPRMILAFAVGAGLSVAGALLQALFANPLCEPYTLGVSSGATLGSVISASLGWTLLVSGIAPMSFVGALVFATHLYWIAGRKSASQTIVLLTGIMLGFMGSSLVALWMALADPAGIQGAILWLLGDLSRARLSGSLFTLTLVGGIVVGLSPQHRRLDALLLGESEALALGVDVPKFRKNLIFISSVLIGACVSSAGMIGFVGLLIPHFARSLRGSLHREMLPVCAVAGGITLQLADTLARVLVRPYELPVGVITALAGAPLFVWLMLRKRVSA